MQIHLVDFNGKAYSVHIIQGKLNEEVDERLIAIVCTTDLSDTIADCKDPELFSR